MFALAELCLHSTTFNFEVVTVYVFIEDYIKNRCVAI
jgi:hypothetical protein